jgi:hypothetical protein
MARPPAKAAIEPPRWLVPAALAVAVAIFIIRTALMGDNGPLFADTDDAMRMVVVRDLIDGQGWYDLVQHRLNTPYGAEIHWSRLIDLPLALMMLAFTPLLGAEGAGIATGYAWPLVLLLVLLWLSARLALRLVGPQGVLPALVLPVLSPALTVEFGAGRVDHHNVVIILTLAIAWTSIEALKRPRFALAAGILCALALAVATESLPTIIGAVLVFGLLFVADPARSGTVRAFGLAFAAAAIANLALARPPSRWLEPACDMLSSAYVGGALAVGAIFALVTLLPAPRAWWRRLLLLACLGFLCLALLLALFPQCLKGPYGALDPWLMENWINRISEAKPWHLSVVDLPAYSLAIALPALLGLLVILVRVIRVPDERGEWLALLVFLGLAALVMFSQVRGARLAVLPAIPAAAWLIVLMRQRYLASRHLRDALALLGVWVAFSGIVVVLLVNGVVSIVPGRPQQVVEARSSRLPCLMPSAFVDLVALPPERIMSPIDLGSHMLLQTPHSVVAAPYHRNAQGVRDTFDFFNQPIEAARAILDARGIGLVVTCPAMAEMRGLPDRAPDSFVELAPKNQLPPWLDDVSLDGPLKVYAVLPR